MSCEAEVELGANTMFTIVKTSLLQPIWILGQGNPQLCSKDRLDLKSTWWHPGTIGQNEWQAILEMIAKRHF